MMKLAKALVVSILLGSLFFVGSAPAASASNLSILRFDTMVGIPSALTGTQSLAPLRGIPGGGLPWMLSEANGSLTVDGRLKVEVQGLVLAAGPRAGTNPVASFRAEVSCVKDDGTFDNILTDTFPATTGPASSGGGDAEIETSVTLPQPCIAPIIFVTSPGGAWFAATGN
ncbi:MAG TPA: hypothetical protein VF784_15450 [Anaerolineales bacterium]